MIQIRFGAPEYGWLPVTFESEGFILEIDASDVPVNPLDELCSALIIVLEGRVAKMGWHLEPAWYYFQFEPKGENIALSILESSSFKCRPNQLSRVTVKAEDLLLSFYEALNFFSATEYGEHWPKLSASKMNKLTMQMEEFKTRL